jgi:hypothetical protein
LQRARRFPNDRCCCHWFALLREAVAQPSGARKRKAKPGGGEPSAARARLLAGSQAETPRDFAAPSPSFLFSVGCVTKAALVARMQDCLVRETPRYRATNSSLQQAKRSCLSCQSKW